MHMVERSTARSLNARTGGGSDGAPRGAILGPCFWRRRIQMGTWLLLGYVTLMCFYSCLIFLTKFYQISTHPWFQSAQTLLNPVFDFEHSSCHSLPVSCANFINVLTLVTGENSNHPFREATLTSTGKSLPKGALLTWRYNFKKQLKILQFPWITILLWNGLFYSEVAGLSIV